MSDTNRVRVSYAKTGQRGGSGVTPSPVDVTAFSPASQLKQLRYTGTPGLGAQPNSVVSNEIRADRQTADSILVGTEAGGNIEFELSPLSFDDFVQAVLFTSYKNTHRVPGSGITVSANNELTLTTGFLADGVLLNAIVRVKLPAVDLDAMYYVSAKTGDVVTLTALRSTDPQIASGTSAANGELIVCGVRADTAGDVSIALNTPISGQATITLANEVSAAWDDGYPNVAGDGFVRPVAGTWVKLNGMVDEGQNVYARVISTTATTIVIEQPTGLTATAATGNPELYWGDYIRNPILTAGVTPSNIGEFATGTIPENSFLFERRYEDHDPITRELVLGCAINSFQLNFEPQSILTGSLELFGFKSNVSNAAGSDYDDVYSALPTDVDASSTDVLNTSTNIGRVAIAATNLLSGDVAAAENLPLGAQIRIGNQLRRRPAVGVFGASSIGAGRYDIGGNINTYFDSDQILQLIVQNQDAEFTVSVSGNDGQGYLFDLPRIKFTSGAPDVPGGDQDAVLNPAYSALRDPTLGYTIHAVRWNFVR